MHGSIASLGQVARRDDIHHAISAGGPDRVDAVSLGTETEQDTVTLMMRDGSRMSVALADPLSQAPELATCLAPSERRPDTVSLTLNDGSRLILSAGDVVGLHLPKEPLPGRTQPGRPRAEIPGAAGVDVHQMGAQRIMRIRDFLPAEVVSNLYRTVLAKQSEFKPSAVLSNDPEYRKSCVLYQFPHFQGLFQNMLREAMPQICEALAIPTFQLGGFECQLTATYDKGYFKPHTDNAAQLGHRRLTYVYYFHRLPKPFTGGDVRFFDHDPFAVDEAPGRHMLDMSPLHNSIVFFDSGCHHEVRETTCSRPSFENARFTVNGWLSQPKSA